MTDYEKLGASIQSIDFDVPFVLNGDAAESFGGPIWAPPAYADESGDHVDSPDWEFVSQGLTGQYGYAGPVMHASEFIGAGIARHLEELSEDFQAFAVVVVEWQGESAESDEPPVGWAIVGYPVVD